MIIRKPDARNDMQYHVRLEGLPRTKAVPSAMTAEALLKRRTERDQEALRPAMLSADSMRNDLYASATGSGISIVAGGMRLLIPQIDSTFETDFTDSQFIHNFVFKASFYEDQIRNTYAGDELEAKLKELDAIAGEVIDKLAGRFASGVGAFFNGTQRWLNDGKPAPSGGGQAFDAGAFKAHVIAMVGQGRAALEDIKQENPEMWADTLRTGGSNGSFFIEALDEAASRANPGASAGIETMGYADVCALSTALGAMGRGIYTNSADMLAAYLGQEKLKSDIIVSRVPMSDTLRQAFTEAVDRNIRIKIASFHATWKRGLDNPDKERRFYDMMKSFASPANGNAGDFRARYANDLKKLYDALTEKPGTLESPKAKQIAMARGCLEMLANDWNRFLDAIGEADGGYAVSGLLGNLVDASF